MKKIMFGVLIIALICVSSGAYAFLSENATVSNDDSTVIESNNDIKINSDDFGQIKVYDGQMNIQNNYPKVEDDIIYIGTYAHYQKGDGVADYYIKCAECGGYIAIGDVTHALPDAALCHNFKGDLGPNYKDYAISYDDAYDFWTEHGCPVYDDGSGFSATGSPIHVYVDLSTIQVDDDPDNGMPLVDLTPC